jgi:hypothetical protein
MWIMVTASAFSAMRSRIIETLELSYGKRIAQVHDAAIFPASLYLAPKGPAGKSDQRDTG